MIVAFLAGLLSFLSPCVLPLVPSYLSYITGMSGVADIQASRHRALLHAALFVLGFTIIFVLLGATATSLGRLLHAYQIWLERIGGFLIVLFGLYLLGVLKVGFLSREMRIQLADQPVSYLGSVIAGMAFGAGWTPCIGPILGSILTMASDRQSVGQGMGLLFGYSLGLAVPFLLAAWALESFLKWFKSFRKYIGWVERIAGVLLIVVGVMMMLGVMTVLSGWLKNLTPEFLKGRL